MRRSIACAVALLSLAACYSGRGTDPDPASTTPVLHPAATPAATVSVLHPRAGNGYSFAANFDAGTINSRADASTPNHLGAVVLPVIVDGRPVQALVLLATFRYSYQQRIGADDHLVFAVSKPLSVGGPDRAFVDIAAPNQPPKRLYMASLPPAGAAGPAWHRQAISLKAYAGMPVTITFGCDALNGDATGAWAAFADPFLTKQPLKHRR